MSEVEVSIRRGSGNYWDGAAFASATEAWNDADLAAGDWSYDFDSVDFPADDSYTVRVRARDAVGNTEAASSRTFAYDATAPQTTIDATPADPAGSADADFEFSANEAGSTFECRIDGGAWGACTSPESYASLSDGSHTFQVRATDVAGNTDGSPASFTWLVDTTDPSSTTAFPADAESYTAGEWNAGCATAGLCGTYGDGGGSGVAEVEVSIRQGSGNYWNGSAFASAPEVWNDATLAAGNWSYAFPAGSFPADGDYTVRVRAVDAVANTETPSSRHLHDRPGRPADDDRLGSRGSDRVDLGGLRLLLGRARLGVRVPDRRGRLGRLQQPEELRRPRRRQPHLPGARHRRRRQRRRHPRLLHLARRHDGTLLDGDLPGRRGELHRGRVGRRLHRRRARRHLRRRRRRRRRRGRGLHPPGLR